MKTIIRKYYQPAILFLSNFTIASIFSLIGVDPLHQGIMFKPALDVAHGQMLFRDTWTQYGALTTLLQAWTLRIFGDYLMVIQIQTAFFYGLISVCLWYLWKRILPQWLTTTSVIIWMLLAPYFLWIFHPWSSVYALFFQLVSLLLLLRAMHDQNRWIVMLAGSVAVLTFWCRQPVGVVHCVSLVLFLATAPLLTGQRWKKAMTDCAFFMAGIVVASAPFFVWLVLNGAVHDWYIQSIKVAIFFGTKMTHPGEISYASQNFFFKMSMALLGFYGQFDRMSETTFIWNLLPLACLFLLAMLAFKRWRNSESVKNNLPLYGLLLVSLASWVQYYPVPSISHLYWAATPMIGVFSYGVWNLCSFRQKAAQIFIVCLILVSVFGFDIEKRFSGVFEKYTAVYVKIEEPKVLRGMYVYPSTAVLLCDISRSLNDAVKKNPFHYLVNLTTDSLYLTFIGPQNNFHPMYIHSWGIYFYPDYNNRLNELIKTMHPVILAYEDYSPLPGWACIDVFNTTDFIHSMFMLRPPVWVGGVGVLLPADFNNFRQKHRLALYQFTGKN